MDIKIETRFLIGIWKPTPISKERHIDDIDILIAGIAIANDLIIVTNNIRDFGKIENLEIRDWSK
ncbi:hypothetical protein PN451_16690 [Dolichospermum planctonicum CS-1226]|uniref:Uncharacterized protein n=1 Tax=Dolichospermum planctonicum CS-1226 TaxID=3021751 RepID=A0ABT5AJF7_9CYAN|nr:hypothetical protein [Dolichospermum planctonicum]MDB9537446.1 hypothetical protein [Dolichospermum planctonicum CS-1226]